MIRPNLSSDPAALGYAHVGQSAKFMSGAGVIELQSGHDLLDTSTDCVKVVGLDGTIVGMNPEGMCLMEIDDFSAVKGKAWADLWPAPHRRTIDAAVAQALKGCVARFSADCPTAKGTPKHWDVLVSPIHDDSGNLVRLLSVSRDVTREVHLAGERALVTRELAHRIKNLFAVVDAMIGLTARSAVDAKTFAQSLRARLTGLGRSVAYIYEGKALPTSRSEDRTVHGLLRELMQPYAQESGVNIVVEGDDEHVSEEAITPLALIVNELATNALKYGALIRPNGNLYISTRRTDDSYHVRWVETSNGPAVAPAAGGFGTTLVDRTVKLQLGGDVSRLWTAQGLEIHFNVPLRELG